MSLEVIIGISVVATLILVVGVHFWLHGLVKFKMDESAIIQCLKANENKAMQAQAIAYEANLSLERAEAVCAKSKSLHLQDEGDKVWSLKQP